MFSANGLTPQVPFGAGGHIPGGGSGASGTGATSKGQSRYANNPNNGNGGGSGHRSNVRVKRNQQIVINGGAPPDQQPHTIINHRGVVSGRSLAVPLSIGRWTISHYFARERATNSKHSVSCN